VRIVGISGSLNPTSANSALLRAMADAAPGEVEVWARVGELPHFVPDGVGGDALDSLRDAMTRADAVVVATPEYAGGMPGSLKNALDWLVGTGELYDKRVAILSAAPSAERGGNARRGVEEVVTMQGARVATSFSVAPGEAAAAVLARVRAALEPDAVP
jgi:NAD(P)H-dependent FMN reductase